VAKPLSDFYRSNNMPSGLQSRCKRCDSESAASRFLRAVALGAPPPAHGATLEDVAVAIGVSRARAAQIERKALLKLRRGAVRMGLRP